MANRSYFRSVLNDNFKILTWILILFIAITPSFIMQSANASAAEKWDRLSLVYDKAGNVINVEHRKMILDAANDAVYKVKVPVTAGAVGTTAASMVRFGFHGAAIAGVIAGAGWLIENGKVVKPVEQDLEPNDPRVQYYWTFIRLPGERWSSMFAAIYATSASLGAEFVRLDAFTQGRYQYFETTKGVYSVERNINPDYDPNFPPTEEYAPVSDSDLGQAIIDSPSAPQILPDIYSPKNPIREQHPSAPAPAPTSVEDALDSANPTPSQDNPPVGSTSPKPAQDTDGDGVPDTVPEGSNFELPAFCSWAMAACDFFGVQKTDNKTTHSNQEKQLEQDKSFFDWFKEMPDLSDDGQLQIDDQSIIFDDSQRITFSSSCPASEKFSVSFFGATQNLEFSYQPLCDFMSMIKPFVIAGSYLIGAYIVMGLSRGSAD